MDTIFALASARGRAGVAVIRISGDRAHEVVRHLCGDVPPILRAALRVLRDSGDVLDEAIVICFGKGASFTGEESAELQVTGSAAVVAAVSGAIARLDGLRPAEPGEFTRRALENGRIDLAGVEGLADLIDAETEAQRRQAQRALSGELGRRVEGWRTALVRMLALLEATIDFADEDVPVDVGPEVCSLLETLLAELRRESAGVTAAERVRDGFEVAIIGHPNAGKSTLLNRIAGRDVALTSAVPGTTRDVIEVRLEIGGLAVTLLDTAGLRGTADEIEAMGVERARSRAAAADLRIFLDEAASDFSVARHADDIVLAGKDDTFERGGVSGLTGAGVDALLERVGSVLGGRAAQAGVLTHLRHAQAVTSAIEAMESAAAGLRERQGAEVVVEDLRRGLVALEVLMGRVDIEGVLGEIFARFCIGK